MSGDLSIASKCYGLYKDDIIIGFLAVIHFPNNKNKKIKKVHRLVILPDYQGIGLGIKFLNKVAQLYENYDFMITTSARNLICGLNKNDNWNFKRYGRMKMNNSMKKSLRKSFRGHVKTATFLYVK